MSENEIQRILIISAHFYPLKGGTPTHTENLCSELSKLGYEVLLVTEDNECSDMDEHDASRNYQVQRLKTSKRFRGDLFFPLLVGLRINKIIKEFYPDVINISTGNYVPLGLKLSKKQKVPIIYTVHNVPPEEYTLNISKNIRVNETVKKYYFKLIRLVAKACMRFGRYDTIISGSERTKVRLMEAGANPENITVINYGTQIPVQKNKIRSDSYNVVTVAGIIEHKGQLEIVKAIPEIITICPKAHFYLVGPVRSEAYLQKILEMIDELSISNSVTVTREVTSEELENYYQLADVYLQPSYQEGFCLALLDALSYGIPVIGTPVGAIPEMIGNNRGVLLTSPSKDEIVSSVISLLQSPKLREEYGKNGREFAMNNFSWKRIAEQNIAVYEEILRKKQTLSES